MIVSPDSSTCGEVTDRAIGDLARRNHHPGGARWLELCREILERRRADGAIVRQRLDRVGAHVVADAAMAVAHQPPHDVGAHPPQSDHPELHRCLSRHHQLLSSCCWGTYCSGTPCLQSRHVFVSKRVGLTSPYRCDAMPPIDANTRSPMAMVQVNVSRQDADRPGGGRRRVVIIGGGFGGLTAARELRRADVEVTLIDPMSHHLFQPLLYQLASGLLSPAECASPIRASVKRCSNTTVLMAKATGLDVERREVVLDRGDRVRLRQPDRRLRGTDLLLRQRRVARGLLRPEDPQRRGRPAQPDLWGVRGGRANG